MSPSTVRLSEALRAGVRVPAILLNIYKSGSMETKKDECMEIRVSVFHCFRVDCRPRGASAIRLEQEKD
jgi:hypothetical protein